MKSKYLVVFTIFFVMFYITIGSQKVLADYYNNYNSFHYVGEQAAADYARQFYQAQNYRTDYYQVSYPQVPVPTQNPYYYPTAYNYYQPAPITYYAPSTPAYLPTYAYNYYVPTYAYSYNSYYIPTYSQFSYYR